jgi:sulfur-oxidizing protein SoxA
MLTKFSLRFHVLIAAALFLVPANAQQRPSFAATDPQNPLKEIISGKDFTALKTRAMQDDEFDNPGQPWLELGAKLWSQADGGQQKSCASCHGEPQQSMKGAAGFPKVSTPEKRVVNLEQQINACRAEKMSAAPWGYDTQESLAMTAFLRNLSLNAKIAGTVETAARPVFEQGRKAYDTKIGQFNLSCADCHNTRYGQKLRGETISQGHVNGFPAYSLARKTMISAHERFRMCNVLVRAEPLQAGADEYVALELYLAWRGAGLPVETPAVRE